MSLPPSYAANRPAFCRREATPWVALVPGYAAFRKLSRVCELSGGYMHPLRRLTVLR
jgi:hypothetical protein